MSFPTISLLKKVSCLSQGRSVFQQPACEEPGDAARKRKARKLIAVLVLVGFGLTLLWLLSWPYFRLNVNSSTSLPGTLYLVAIKQSDWRPARGETIIFWPPGNPVYKDGSRFVKIVKGVPGDTVEFRGHDFYINGEKLGVAKPFSKTGRELKQAAGGIIPEDHYFVWTPHKDSYDSRYLEIGLIARDRIFGTAYRLF